MSEIVEGSSDEPPTPNEELISRDINAPTAQFQVNYNRYGQFIPFYEVYPSDDEEDKGQTKPVDYQVHPLASLHTEYKPGTEDWEVNTSEWTDIGQRYKKGPEFSLRCLLGIKDKPIPSDEIRHFQKRGIKFEKELGSGAYGTVWLVTKTTIKQGQLEKIRMACKILNLTTFGEPSLFKRYIVGQSPKNVEEAVEEMVSEAELHRKLIHKHIVECKYVFKIQDPKTGFPYCRLLMFMELCDGDLLTLIMKSPDQKFNVVKAKEMLRQVSEGLQYMHDKHICHLDIKSENILYVIESGAQIIYKLSDLGLSISFESDQHNMWGRIGTILYMAPEIKSGGSYLPKPGDIYALGCVLAQTVVGQKWWQIFIETLQKCTRDMVATICSSYNITPLCADLIFRMTNINPDQRPTIGTVIKDTWLN